jgi:aspartyl-tRNA(Asn)/glutamyl-tRNA(Gln) amidotransferase subunit B
MRSKETAQEYRYFPEPDLKPLIITEEEIAQVRSSMPMLPSQKREYFEKELGLASYDAGILTKSRQITEYFEKVLSYGVPAKQAANWIGTDLLGALNACGKEIQDSPLPPSEIATLIKFIQEGKISIKMAREIFPKAFNENKKIADLVKSLGQTQINDEAQIEVWAKQAVEANPKAVADYKSGNTKAIGAMVGMVMKLSKGKANPAIINKILVRLMS